MTATENLLGMFGVTPKETTETITFTLWPCHREEMSKFRAALDDAINAVDDLLAGELTPEARTVIRAHTNGYGEWKPVATTTVPALVSMLKNGEYATGDDLGEDEENDDADTVEQSDFAGDEDAGHEEALFGDC